MAASNFIRLSAVGFTVTAGAVGCLRIDVHASVTDFADALAVADSGCGFNKPETWLMPDCAAACFPGACPPQQFCQIGTALQCSEIACSEPTSFDGIKAWRVTAARILPLAESCELEGKKRNAAAAILANGVEAQLGQDSGEQGAFGVLAVSLDPTGKLGAADWLIGNPAPGGGSCGDSSATCKVAVRKQSWDLGKPGTCVPLSRCKAQSDGQDVQIDCPTMAPFVVDFWGPLLLTGHDVSITGTLSAATGTGVLRVCGRYWASEIGPQKKNLSKPMLAKLADRLNALVPDFDHDLDTVNDQATFAFEFKVAPAQLTGPAAFQ